MAHADQLMNYFGNTRVKPAGDRWVGAEIETFFVCSDGTPITFEQSQRIMLRLRKSGWEIAAKRGEMLTELKHGTSKILYELGYPNIELAIAPHPPEKVVEYTRVLLKDLYREAEACGAYPFFAPIFPGDGDYLAIPDERDAGWLGLDGRKALLPLARISAVQFTFDVSLDAAIPKLNRLLAQRDGFLSEYPQDVVWREYIRSSSADYRSDRYGGPREFKSLSHYCDELARHAVVRGTSLVSFGDAAIGSNAEVTLFIRSVWWYFRLRRYGQNLCIEVRPLPRRRDEMIETQFNMVLNIME